MATLHGWSYRPRFDLVANLFAGKAASGEEITVQGGKQRRPLLHIEDAADAFIAALKAPKTKVAGQVFNVGFTRENYTILEIADLIKKNKPDAKIKIDEKVTDKRDYWVDFSKIESVLRIKPKRNIDESVKEIMREVRKKKIDIRNPKYSNYLQVLNTR
jgi:nucleoside-diphosphate-sugar epimerase